MSATPPGEHFRHGTVPAAGFVLDYAESGPADAAVTVVCLPGSAGLEMSTAKDILARSHRVVEINPPGWGGKDDLTRSITQTELGLILAEAVDQLVPGDYFVVGTSMGGCHALVVAAERPGRVRGIVLEGSMAPARLEDLWSPPPAPRPSDEPAPDPAADADSGPPQYPLPPTDPRKPWADQDYIARQMANRFAMFRWVTPEFMPEQAIKLVNDRGVPVLALLGIQDEILRPTQQETIAQALPHATFRLVPDGPHDLQNTVPDRFVAEVEQFIGHA